MLTNKWIKGIEDLTIVDNTRKEILNTKLNAQDLYSWHLVLIENNINVAVATITPYEDGFLINNFGVKTPKIGYGDLMMRLIDRKLEMLEKNSVYAQNHSFFKKYGFEGDTNVVHTTKIKPPIYCKEKR